MPMELPAAIVGYVSSANAHDAEACAGYFTRDAVVHDEGQDRRGIAAIRDWKEEVSRKYRPAISIVDAVKRDGKVIVAAKVSGNFLGSPVDLQFAFTLRGEKIARLDIAP